MITARDIARDRAAPPGATAVPAPTTALSERLLLMVLYITVLASSVAIIEPSPHDGLMGVLAIACFAAGVRFDRHIALLFLLLLVFNVAGLLSLLNVPGQEMTVQYSITSIYLGVAAVLFAALFASNTMPRIVTVRAAYVLTATVIALAGIAGYFSLFPHAHDLFATNDRALGAFKDPNVYGPFLIWPALVVLERMLARRLAPHRRADRRCPVVRFALELFTRRLVSSRGVMRGHDDDRLRHGGPDRERMRIFALGAIGIAAVAGFIVLAAVVRFGRQYVPAARAAHPILRRRQRRALPPAGIGAFGTAQLSERHGPVRIFPRLRHAATQRLPAGLPGLRLDRRHGLYHAAGRHMLDGLAHRLRAHAVATLSQLRVRRLRRRSGRGFCDRYRSLAAFLSVARHDLGLGGGDA